MYLETARNDWNAAAVGWSGGPEPVGQARAAGAAAPATHRFDAGDLYGRGGPRASDIQQDALGDCYFVATLAAVADANPQAIRDAIRFDPRTGDFIVRLHNDRGEAQSIRVSQAELAYNLQRRGGSTADNTGRDERLWPAVMETAYAKMRDTNHADGLREGFDAISRGGHITDAMRAITGDAGDSIRFSQGWFESQGQALDRLAGQVDAALANGRPVTLATRAEDRSILDRILGRQGPQDGLVDLHAYSVESITRDRNGEWQVVVRNPWGSNSNVGEGRDTPSATLTVPLRTLVETNGLQYFNAGPAN
jgi:hypothetical protein